MTYSATVVRVMIASPGDVLQERQIVRDVIRDWNVVHAEDRRVILMPLSWDTHASPEMGERAQAIINKQVLKEADLVVAVFWTRLGSPTGVSPSGTVEEIEEHIRNGKAAMIYFSDAPVRLDSVDNSQYSALLAFKHSCRNRGLVEEYDDLAAFKEKFTRQLAQTVIRHFTGSTDEHDDQSAASQRRPAHADRHPRAGLQQPILGPDARTLLIETSRSASGTILVIRSLAGTSVQVGDRLFTMHGNAMSEARWRAAVDQLAIAGLIEDKSGKGEVFGATIDGYKLADSLLGGLPSTD